MDNAGKDSKRGETMESVNNGDLKEVKRKRQNEGEPELDIMVANDVVMMAEKVMDAEQRTWIRLKENGISIKVCTLVPNNHDSGRYCWATRSSVRSWESE